MEDLGNTTTSRMRTRCSRGTVVNILRYIVFVPDFADLLGGTGCISIVGAAAVVMYISL